MRLRCREREGQELTSTESSEFMNLEKECLVLCERKENTFAPWMPYCVYKMLPGIQARTDVPEDA